MFKRLYYKKKVRRDLRFVDPEKYREQRQPSRRSAALPQGQRAPLPPQDDIFVAYPGAQTKGLNPSHRSDSAKTEPGTYPSDSIFVDRPGRAADLSTDGYLVSEHEGNSDLFTALLAGSEPARQLYRKQLDKQQAKPGAAEGKKRRHARSRNYQKSLGIFSDSKMYSVMIHNELKDYALNIRLFQHPLAYREQRHPVYERIEAWILFTSDDGDEHFLDSFLDRYHDKPTLFLCPKMSRKSTTKQIRNFIQANGLEIEAKELS